MARPALQRMQVEAGKSVRTAGAAQSHTLVVAAGASRTPNTVAAGGVAFEPLAAGSTSVGLTAAGAVSIGPVNVTVTPCPSQSSDPAEPFGGIHHGTETR